MNFCPNCGTQNSGNTKFCGSCGQDMQSAKSNPVITETTTSANVNSNVIVDSSYQPKPPNQLVWAILTTFFCCLPIGIVSIMYASKVDNLYAAKQYDEARQASKNASKWAIIGAIGGFFVLFFYFILMVISAAAQ